MHVITKLLNDFEHIARVYGKADLIANRDNVEHDLKLVFDKGNMAALTLSAKGHDGLVVYQHAVTFGKGQQGYWNTAGGIEVPILKPGLVGKWEWSFTGGPHGFDWDTCAYHQQFKVKWTDAQPAKRAAGTAFCSEHTRQKSGGTAQAEVFAAASARRFGTVAKTGDKGFYFIDPDDRTNPVFALEKMTSDNLLPIRPGARVSYTAIASPRGVQARDIRAA